MALKIFRVIGEGSSDILAFKQAQQSPLLAGRINYKLLDPSTVFPSDAHATLRSEDYFGIFPDATRVDIAAEGMNMVWAVRIYTGTTKRARLLFFGLHRT
jgi:hypothetical protein